MKSLGALLLLATACTSLSVQDVERQFGRDADSLWIRVPSKDNLNPAIAENAATSMSDTEKIASEFVSRHASSRSLGANYGRALLASCYLMQGRNDAARGLFRDFRTRRTDELTRENAIVFGTVHAIGACRAVEARAALERMFDGALGIEEFVAQYGSFVGVNLPPPDYPGHDKLFKLEVARIRSTCFSSAEETETSRADLRRLVGEVLYNEAASLLVNLPPPRRDAAGRVERWLATVAVGSFVAYGHIIPDLLPYRLTAEQKQWQREQIEPVYARAREAAGHFLDAAERRAIDKSGLRVKDIRNNRDAYRALYAALVGAETQVIGWISTR
ncbi:MAG: hypothetical protein ACYTEZ_04710 [Planctomycetota bacterium]